MRSHTPRVLVSCATTSVATVWILSWHAVSKDQSLHYNRMVHQQEMRRYVLLLAEDSPLIAAPSGQAASIVCPL